MGAVSRNVNRLVMIAGLAFGTMALAGCDSAEERLAKHVASGEELVQDGALAKATVEFRNALAIDANSVAAHSGMAEVYEAQRNYPAMIAHLNKIVEIDPVNVGALVKLGQMMLLGGQLDEALANADSAIAAEPKNVDALVLKAGISLRLGNTDTALDFAQQAIALDPANPTAHAVLIGERLQAEDIERALAIANDITERAPQDMGVALVKLQVLEKRGDAEEVGAYLQQLVERFPDQVSLRSALSRWYAERGQDAEAEAQLRAIAEANPDDSDAALRVAQFILAKQGDEAARAELERLVAEKDEKTPYQVALAQIDYEGGEQEAAKTRLAGVIQDAEDAGNSADANSVRLMLARFLLRENARDEAKALVKTVLEGDAANADALALRAALRYDDEDYSNALLDIRAALASAPNNPQLLLLSARTHLKTGSTDIAGENFAAAMQAANYAPDITMEYVKFLRLDNRDDAVLTVLTQAVRAQPGNEKLLNALAAEQLRVGDWAAADETAKQLAQINSESSIRVRAATLSGRERYDESLALLDSLSKEPGQSDGALAAMVQVYFKAGKIDEAMDFLGGVLAENPANAQALMLRAALNISEKKTAAAEADYKAALAAAPTVAPPYLALARLYLREGREDEAVAMLKEGVEATDDPSGLMLFLGGYYESKQRVDDAIAQYRALFEARPDSLVAANNLASLLVEYKADDEAAKAEAAKIAGSLRGVSVPAFQDTYGWVQYQLGNYEEALRYLVPAADALSDNPFVRYHAGLAYAALGDGAAARPHLEAALATPDFAFADEAKAALATLDANQ
ncbi:tetratricopeptide repeat protein [Pikeienuella piscinae]|uniref:Tetratricopeptide repeat protein n=1 Tax=Pikeienuella piscinae TaxID=2748098 RepID=A0A7M3T6K8_9RHOB|nr:tetratricopeptide repeat protein [Pikeienuella piscinae]QIE57639.1 tetratricopeptide repeat protein [Pikeienuella piscinae]